MIFRTLNPAKQQDEGGDCPDFMSDTLVSYAYGWTRMFDKLVCRS